MKCPRGRGACTQSRAALLCIARERETVLTRCDEACSSATLVCTDAVCAVQNSREKSVSWMVMSGAILLAINDVRDVYLGGEHGM